MPNGTGLDAFSKKFPERFFDVGIAEQHAVTFAAGLARNGLVPVFAVYSSFYKGHMTRYFTMWQFKNYMLFLPLTGQVL